MNTAPKVIASLAACAVLAACSGGSNGSLVPSGLSNTSSSQATASYHEVASAAHMAYVRQFVGQNSQPVTGSGGGGITPQGSMTFNCQDWYLAAIPGVHNQETDTYLGTTCDTLYLPDFGLGGVGGPIGGGGGGGGIGVVDPCNGNLDGDGCQVASEPTCNGGRGMGDSANGYDGHNNAISGEFEVFSHSGDTSQTIGWEYQTYGGQEFFQFNFTVSVSAGVSIISGGFDPGSSPVVPFDGNVYKAVQGALHILNLPQSALPAPFNTLSGRTTVNKISCGTGTGGKTG